VRGTETKAPTFVVGQVTRVDGHIRTTAPSHAHAHQRMKKNGGNSEETEIETACYYFKIFYADFTKKNNLNFQIF
jgi:hypothetical protein